MPHQSHSDPTVDFQVFFFNQNILVFQFEPEKYPFAAVFY